MLLRLLNWAAGKLGLPRFRTADSVYRELVDGLNDGSVVLDPPDAPPPG